MYIARARPQTAVASMAAPWPHPRRWAQEILHAIYWRTAVRLNADAHKQVQEALLASLRDLGY